MVSKKDIVFVQFVSVDGYFALPFLNLNLIK
jgi:hypothetical protein